MLVRSGEFTAKFIEDVDEDMIQPNGVDLRIGNIFKLHDRAKVTQRGTWMPTYIEVEWSNEGNSIKLGQGTYIVEYESRIEIPDDCVGLVLPRSSVMRAGSMINTALWDSGYEGVGVGLFQVGHKIKLEKGTRIAQMVFISAESSGQYDGQYQGEERRSE